MIKLQGHTRFLVVLLVVLSLATMHGCVDSPAEPNGDDDTTVYRSPRLGIWLAKKGELIEHENATFDLVMTGWFDVQEAADIRDRHPSAILLAGLSLNWVSGDPEWQTFLVTVANGGDPGGPLQITEDMFLMYDDDEDGVLDRRCAFPGWADPAIYAMDPRHTGWQELILSFYDVVASQPQHDGVVVDMLDAYSFCSGAWSEGVPIPIDADAWVSGQEELLSTLRDNVAEDKWVIANAGCDFPEGSSFPQYLNGYLLENALGVQCGLDVDELLASSQRALESTSAPHVVVYAVDTDDTGEIDWPRLRTGLVASLLTDHTYFAFDFGPRDHGGVTDYWFPQYYDVMLGDPTAPYYPVDGGYRRDFEDGLIVAAVDAPIALSLGTSHTDIATGASGTDFTVPQGDAGVFLREDVQ
jgi:hypothetical protein